MAHTNFIKYCCVTLTTLGKRPTLVSEKNHPKFSVNVFTINFYLEEKSKGLVCYQEAVLFSGKITKPLYKQKFLFIKCKRCLVELYSYASY